MTSNPFISFIILFTASVLVSLSQPSSQQFFLNQFYSFTYINSCQYCTSPSTAKSFLPSAPQRYFLIPCLFLQVHLIFNLAAHELAILLLSKVSLPFYLCITTPFLLSTQLFIIELIPESLKFCFRNLCPSTQMLACCPSLYSSFVF